MRRPILALAAIVLIAVGLGLLLRGHAASQTRITVLAASSLTDAFPALAPGETYSFGGSNDLVAQIRQGAPADVFASANTAFPAELHAQGLCSTPVVFTRNELVVIVPKANPAHVRGIRDLASIGSGVRLVIAAEGVPVGDYTLAALDKLGIRPAVERNVVSRESDARGVLSKVALGEADAGFVYATDAKTAAKRLRVIEVPARAEPRVEYGICVVSHSNREADARAFVRAVLSAAGQRTLERYGFLPR
ncbi:MAG: molybdate transport system substrate-binding protein [Gaiellaceae bacterium]|jgi:molybdate transport system substrate-binding protein|nr:molybdate transport system substrate-binding protein [Gaiellaceae bacterium]